MRPGYILALSILLAPARVVYAHGGEAHPDHKTGPVKKEQTAWGIAGDASRAARTIDIKMLDAMRFSPDVVEVRQGETVKFVMTNTGKLMHELVIGTKKELQEHAALMAKFPNMEHDEPYMAHVQPGQTGEIVWTFNRAGEFDFGCLIPGHYESGMVGKIKVARAPTAGQ